MIIFLLHHDKVRLLFDSVKLTMIKKCLTLKISILKSCVKSYYEVIQIEYYSYILMFYIDVPFFLFHTHNSKIPHII